MAEDIQSAILDEIKALRRDIHWLARQKDKPPIWDEEGCCCAYYRDEMKHDAWTCPRHGRVEK